VLVPVADPAALAAALADLLADPDRRKQLAEVGRETVQQYDWQTVTARIVEVYETVVAAVPRDTEFAVDVDHAVDAFADDLAGDDDDPSRLSAALRRWLSRTPS
jgi:phosphatidylinositol alpha-mannosyltransferase